MGTGLRPRARDGGGEAAHQVQRFTRSTSSSLSSGYVLGLLLAPINVMSGFPAPKGCSESLARPPWKEALSQILMVTFCPHAHRPPHLLHHELAYDNLCAYSSGA